jgi:hypothetical protein
LPDEELVLEEDGEMIFRITLPSPLLLLYVRLLPGELPTPVPGLPLLAVMVGL